MELVKIEEIEDSNVPQVFQKGGLRPIIDAIKIKAKQEVNDVTTAKGRKEIASLAYSITRSKTYLDSKGKDYVATLKALPGVVDQERRNMRTELDELAEEIRKPLTQWEEAEEARVALIREKIDFIKTTGLPEDGHTGDGFSAYSSSEIQGFIKALEATAIDDSFEEFAVEAAKEKDGMLTQLRAQFIILKNEEEETAKKARAEEARLKQEREDREQKIADDAAAKAKKEAEEETQRKADEKAQKIKDAQIEKDRKAKEAQDKKDKEAQDKIDKANKKAEDARLEKERIKKEAADREAEELRLKKEEGDRIAAEKADEELQARKKKETLDSLYAIVSSEPMAINLYKAIVSGKIPHVEVV